MKSHRQSFIRNGMFWLLLGGCLLWAGTSSVAWAQDTAEAATESAPQLNIRDLFEAGGVVGMIILVLSVAMVALVVEHLISFRRRSLMPPALAEDVHKLITQEQYQQAEQLCKQRPSFLGHILTAGLAEAPIKDYALVEKALEDSSREQSARMFRKIEYLSVIGTLAPMLGLLGTVWGMILAFMEFETKSNPQVSELAPGIYKALVTTFLGLSVAVPALASFAIFRNRIDELVAEASLLAEHVFVDYKRKMAKRKRSRSSRKSSSSKSDSRSTAEPERQRIPPVAMERKKP